MTAKHKSLIQKLRASRACARQDLSDLVGGLSLAVLIVQDHCASPEVVELTAISLWKADASGMKRPREDAAFYDESEGTCDRWREKAKAALKAAVGDL